MTSALAKRLAEKIAISAHGLHHERLASGRADEYAALIDAELAGVVGNIRAIDKRLFGSETLRSSDIRAICETILADLDSAP